jgi:large-conductance mechanosensitive channel
MALFLVVRQMNTLRRVVEGEATGQEKPLPADVVLLTEIRDLLKGRQP